MKKNLPIPIEKINEWLAEALQNYEYLYTKLTLAGVVNSYPDED